MGHAARSDGSLPVVMLPKRAPNSRPLSVRFALLDVVLRRRHVTLVVQRAFNKAFVPMSLRDLCICGFDACNQGNHADNCERHAAELGTLPHAGRYVPDHMLAVIEYNVIRSVSI